MQTGNEGMPASQRIVEFMQRNRKPVFAAAAVSALAMVGSVGWLIAADALRGRAISAAEELASRYEALRGDVSPDSPAGGELESLLADLEAFASGRSGYAGARAWSMAAGLRGRSGDWAGAEAAWLSAAAASPGSYMAPFAFFNAGAAAEEQGRLEEAILHYGRSISAPAGFFAAARAQFSIGRLREALGDFEEAARAYRALAAGWPGEAAFAGLARSRLVAIETAGARPAEPEIRPDPPAPEGFGPDGFDFGDFDFGDFDFGGFDFGGW